MGVWGRTAPINLLTGIRVTHTDQRRAHSKSQSTSIPRPFVSLLRCLPPPQTGSPRQRTQFLFHGNFSGNHLFFGSRMETIKGTIASESPTIVRRWGPCRPHKEREGFGRGRLTCRAFSSFGCELPFMCVSPEQIFLFTPKTNSDSLTGETPNTGIFRVRPTIP